ncbi:hypothetical protein F5148DRAFT_1187803 [Russula earlei]|uniref:Uncharacterized protein n=1 Tax=Russula earlei TaxID=71964 RepID=A0ACC0UEC8_9AGAM|nr:hypothetical protein F5148DRAFT_1187803 [Russula earlei]
MYGRSRLARRGDGPNTFKEKQRKNQFAISRISSPESTTRTAAVAQTPSLRSTKRGRLYGLNSRFDRMMQEVGLASRAPTSLLPHRRRAYSRSSSITNHDLPKTPSEASNIFEHSSSKVGECFVAATPKIWPSDATRRKSAHLNLSQVVKKRDQVNVESPPKLPEWLNNTLVTLPYDHAVRCLALSPDRPIRTDHIDGKSEASDEGSVFTFQAPAEGHHPVNHTGNEGQSRTDVATFRFAHDGSLVFQGANPTASLVSTIPFSTPGPGWAIHEALEACYPRRPFSAIAMPRLTGTGTQSAMDKPLPFSTPGPFVPARAINDPLLDYSPAASHHVSCDKMWPVVERNGAPSFPGPCATGLDRLNAPPYPIQGENGQLLEPFSFTLNDVAGSLASLDTISPTVYYSTVTEKPSSPAPESEPISPKDRSVVDTSPRGFTWGSPTAVTRWPGAMDTTICGAFPQILSPNLSSPISDTESSLIIHKRHKTGADMQLPVTPPPSGRLHPDPDFDWISWDAGTRNPEVLGSIESV